MLLLPGLTAAEMPPVPDPFGLGERLALIDYLREQGQEVAAGATLDNLRARYQQLHQQDERVDTEAVALADQQRRLRRELVTRYHLSVPQDASLSAMQALLAEHEREVQVEVDAMLAASAATAPDPATRAPQQASRRSEEPDYGQAPTQTQTQRPRRSYPAVFTERIHKTPDLYQASKRLGHDGGGYFHCAPTAVSNSLMWLASEGYPKFAFDRPGQDRAHWELAKLLAGTDYMDTAPRSGTSMRPMLQGLERFINECGYEIAHLETQGLPFQGEFQHWFEPTSLDFIKGGLQGPSAIWLAVGYYTERDGVYSRRAGHLVTVSGYGRSKRGDRDPNILIINDPGDGNRNIMAYVRTGTLPQDSRMDIGASLGGFLTLGEDYPSAVDDLVAVVDLVAHLQMR